MVKVFKTPRLVRWIYPRRLWGFTNSNKVYLTFDDGPTTQLTPWILDTLKQNGIKATFFCVGQNVEDHPELYQSILRAGHAIGNHTMQHNNAHKTKKQDYFDSIEASKELMATNLFRPPYGRLSLLKGAKIDKDFKIVMWSWLSYDYDQEVPIEKIIKSAKEDIKGGDILVLHDNMKVNDRLKVLLPEIIAIVKEKELEFDVISV